MAPTFKFYNSHYGDCPSFWALAVNEDYIVKKDCIPVLILLIIEENYNLSEIECLTENLRSHFRVLWLFRRIEYFTEYVKWITEQVMVTVVCVGKPTEDIVDLINIKSIIQVIYIYDYSEEIDLLEFFRASNRIRGFAGSVETIELSIRWSLRSSISAEPWNIKRRCSFLNYSTGENLPEISHVSKTLNTEDDLSIDALLFPNLDPEETNSNSSVNLLVSDTVSPITAAQRPSGPPDSALWPSVTVIEDQSGLVTNDLCSYTDLVTAYPTLEDYQRDGNEQRNPENFFILPNPRNGTVVLKLFTSYPNSRIYIHSTSGRLDYFDRLAEKYPNRCFVYQKLDTLRYAVRLDLSDCIVKLAEYYDRSNRVDLAQTRYRYAYKLRLDVQRELDRQLTNVQCNS